MSMRLFVVIDGQNQRAKISNIKCSKTELQHAVFHDLDVKAHTKPNEFRVKNSNFEMIK